MKISKKIHTKNPTFWISKFETYLTITTRLPDNSFCDSSTIFRAFRASSWMYIFASEFSCLAYKRGFSVAFVEFIDLATNVPYNSERPARWAHTEQSVSNLVFSIWMYMSLSTVSKISLIILSQFSYLPFSWSVPSQECKIDCLCPWWFLTISWTFDSSREEWNRLNFIWSIILSEASKLKSKTYSL